MNRLAYEGFKIALESGIELHSGRCFSCHHLPDLGPTASKPPIPSLRNRSFSDSQLQEVLANETHRDIGLDKEDLNRLHSLLQTFTDVPDADFRDLILKATVLDTSGDPE
jgi:hypothetical protein